MKNKINYKGNDFYVYFSMTDESKIERIFFADGEEVDFYLKAEITDIFEKMNEVH